MKKHLLVIDLQKQFSDTNGQYEKCLQYIKQHHNDYDSVYATLFKQNIDKNPNYVKHLNWDGCKQVCENDLEYIDALDCKNIIYKYGYGDTSEHQFLTTALFSFHDEIHIIGCDLDACIMAICFQLWDAGFNNFKVLTEYCYTTAKDINKEDIIKIMKRNFGDCIV